MNKKTFYIIFTIIGFCSLLTIFILNLNSKEEKSTQQMVFLDNSENSFQQAIEIREFTFPKDFGKHEDFQTEWWYYTGNLFDTTGRHFGYQLTFFRRGISSNTISDRESEWATNQIYFAHFTITDSENNQHFQKEEFSRGALDLAGVNSDDFLEVWLHDWKVLQTSQNSFDLSASTEDFSINLSMEDLKKPIFHGTNGLSIKGDLPGNASYYFSQTRLKSNGNIRIGNDQYQVSGFSWMDHEFGSNTLGKEQIGWDWFSLQMDDNQELMLFQIRQNDLTVSPHSSGTFIMPDSTTKHLTIDHFDLTVLEEWETTDGYKYPSKWAIEIDDEEIALIVEPVINQQENQFFFRYWEGAVKVTGVIGGKQITGYGYVELTGYVQSMQGVF